MGGRVDNVDATLSPHEILVCTMAHTNFAGAPVAHLGPLRHSWVYNNLIGPQTKGLYHWNGQIWPGGCMGVQGSEAIKVAKIGLVCTMLHTTLVHSMVHTSIDR